MEAASLALAGLEMNDLGVGRYELKKFPSFVCYTGVSSLLLFVLFEACSLATSDTHRGLSSAGNLPLDETTRATAAAAPFTHLNFAALVGGSGFFIVEGGRPLVSLFAGFI